MKKLAVLVFAVVMLCSFTACGTNTASTEIPYKVAMITDYGDVTDGSFNQATYEGCKEFCDKNDVALKYYMPGGDSTIDRVAMIDKAVADGYNVVVMPGSSFGPAIEQVADIYSDVKFIALDVAQSDIGDYQIGGNVFCAIYQEEIAGFMAGYAAVELGYTHLGFLGGLAVPSVVRYGYGFVQGADYAAAKEGTEIDIEYAYGNQFYGDDAITAYVDEWYQGGTECVFACGGSIYTSVAESAAKAKAKVIGVDVDQAATIDSYREHMTVTSAMKGLAETVDMVLSDLCISDGWSKYSGKLVSLGMVSGSEPEKNYVQLPESTQWSKSFTQKDYKKLVANIFDGNIEISNSISEEPAVTNTKVDYQGYIK